MTALPRRTLLLLFACALAALLAGVGTAGAISTTSAQVDLTSHALNASTEGVFATYSQPIDFQGVIRASVTADGSFGDGCAANRYPGANTTYPSPWIALVLRGNCTFVQKTVVADQLGAAGILIANDDPENTIVVMAGTPPSGLDAPAISIGRVDGYTLFQLSRDSDFVHISVTAQSVDGHFGGLFFQHTLIFLSLLLLLIFVSGAAVFTRAAMANRTYRRHRAEVQARITAHETARRAAIETAIEDLPRTTHADALKEHPECSSLESCAVCLDEYDEVSEVTRLPCHHFYHPSCIDEWLVTNPICPLCKAPIIKAEPNDNTAERNSDSDDDATHDARNEGAVRDEGADAFLTVEDAQGHELDADDHTRANNSRSSSSNNGGRNHAPDATVINFSIPPQQQQQQQQQQQENVTLRTSAFGARTGDGVSRPARQTVSGDVVIEGVE